MVELKYLKQARLLTSSCLINNNPKSDASLPGAAPTSKDSLPTLAVKEKSVDRYIPASVKRAVWARDFGRCTHSGCSSEHKLQFDHILPIALGGATSVSNLRLLCRTHNLLADRLSLGDDLMSRYLRS